MGKTLTRCTLILKRQHTKQDYLNLRAVATCHGFKMFNHIVIICLYFIREHKGHPGVTAFRCHVKSNGLDFNPVKTFLNVTEFPDAPAV